MTKNITLFIFFILCAPHLGQSQSLNTLRSEIQAILESKNAAVGVAIKGPAGDTLSVNGQRHFPMQSVFKFHIGLFVLSQVDKGKFKLSQKIRITKDQLLPGLYSPIRDKYPNGTTLTLAEVLQYTVSLSDNVGCDALLRMVGGPEVVEKYFTGLGFNDISIKINEETMQGNWDEQFRNWITPLESGRILEAFYNNKPQLLTPASHAFIWRIMRETSTGPKRLKGQLPPNADVAHKTGWSGTNSATGITAAVNDIGVLTLPDGKPLFISVFVTDSKEDLDTNERIIAEVAEVTWRYFGGGAR